MNNDPEFKELEGKIISKVIRHNGNIIISFTDETYAGFYNKGQIIDGELELGIKNYN